MHRFMLLAVLVLGYTGTAAGSGATICNMPEVGTLQAGSTASSTAQIRCLFQQNDVSQIFLDSCLPLS